MTVVNAGKQYAPYAHSPFEPAGINAFPITPFDGPITLGGSNAPYVPYNTYSGSKAAIARNLFVGVSGNLEVTLANDFAASGILPAAVSGNTITITGHKFVTGDRVMVANSGGGLPSGLSAQTAYFVIVVDANDIQLASSLANAQAATAVTLSSAGTGTQSVFKTTQIHSAANGYHPLCVSQVNAATTATNIVGLY